MRLKQKESDIQKSILEYLSYCEGIYFFRAGSGAIKTAEGRYFKSGRAGCPDVIVCDRGGKFVGLEVKTKYGKQSEAQRQAEGEIKTAGGKYYIVHSLEAVQELIPIRINK